MTLPSGIPIDELDSGFRPQDDLFRHVNGRWLARTEIPADRARYGTFQILAEEAEKAVREIVEGAASAPAGSDERKFGDLYASFMDADRAELLGSQPISQALAAAQAVSSVPELKETLGRLERLGVRGLYQILVEPDPGNPQRYVVFFEQGAISLPDESYYREDRFARVRDAFAGHVRRMLELAGLPDAERAASRVLALERAVAGHHWDNVASRDEERSLDNLLTLGRRPVCRAGSARVAGGPGHARLRRDRAPPAELQRRAGLVAHRRASCPAGLSYVCPVDDAAESFVVGVVVAPDDVPADHAGLLLVAGVVGAVEREVAQGRELGLDAVQPRRIGRGIGDLDVVRRRPGPDPGVLAVLRCGLKLSQMIAILVAGGYSERRYRQNSRNRVRVLRGLICPYSLSSPSS